MGRRKAINPMAEILLLPLLLPGRAAADLAPPRPILVDREEHPLPPGDIETALASEFPPLWILLILAVLAAVLARLALLLLRRRRKKDGRGGSAPP